MRTVVKQTSVVDISDPLSNYKVRLRKFKHAIVTLDENFVFPPKAPIKESSSISESRPYKIDISTLDEYTEWDLYDNRKTVKLRIREQSASKPLIVMGPEPKKPKPQ